MKLCYTCKQTKSLNEFNKNKARVDGLNSICRECSKKRSRQYYSENTEHHKKITRQRAKQHRIEMRVNMRAYLESHPCVDCGNSDIRVLEFDHKNPKSKLANVSTLLNGDCSWARIYREILKCDVVCANCHRIRTAIQFNTWRNC